MLSVFSRNVLRAVRGSQTVVHEHSEVWEYFFGGLVRVKVQWLLFSLWSNMSTTLNRNRGGGDDKALFTCFWRVLFFVVTFTYESITEFLSFRTSKQLHAAITFFRSWQLLSYSRNVQHFSQMNSFQYYPPIFKLYYQVLNLVVCILLRVLDQVQGFPSNATLF
jgi:hypothetical protein